MGTGQMLHVQCALTRRQHFSVCNDVMATILKLWYQIEDLIPSIDVYLLEEQSCQISPRSNLKWRSTRLFWRGHFKKNNKKKKKLSSDMRSVPDLKIGRSNSSSIVVVIVFIILDNSYSIVSNLYFHFYALLCIHKLCVFTLLFYCISIACHNKKLYGSAESKSSKIWYTNWHQLHTTISVKWALHYVCRCVWKSLSSQWNIKPSWSRWLKISDYDPLVFLCMLTKQEVQLQDRY